jgi:16S rRNA (uracil1498-N3)-methyltransferase
MHRFYLPPEDSRGDVLTLTGSEAHHATRVLRLREQERVVVLDGAGLELRCEVTGQTGKSVVLKVIERRAAVRPACAITLVQAIPKAKLIESIIQKATELGASRIVPILTERVITHLESESAKAKAEKWQQVAIEAMKQCGNPWLPKVEPPISLKSFLARNEVSELALVGCLQPGSRHPREWLEEFRAVNRRLPENLCVWVGPEGDFTADEYAAIQKSGALPITLGPLVLRVETAATYCLSVLNYELQAPRAG